MIGRRAEAVIQRAIGLAVLMKHEYLTLEHLLLSLLEEPRILEVIEACGVDFKPLKEELDHFVKNEIPRVQTSATGDEDQDSPVEHLPGTTLGVQRLIQRALFHVQSSGKDEITPVDLFIAFF